jgi:hypothetical protein
MGRQAEDLDNGSVVQFETPGAAGEASPEQHHEPCRGGAAGVIHGELHDPAGVGSATATARRTSNGGFPPASRNP